MNAQLKKHAVPIFPAPFTAPVSVAALVAPIAASQAPDAADAHDTPPEPPERRFDALEAPFVKAKFEGLVLVCGQCEKRGSGPSKLTAKDARKSLKSALGAQRTRMRIVQSSCLGLCPKKSIAIAAAAQGTSSVLAEVRNERDLRAVAERLGKRPQNT